MKVKFHLAKWALVALVLVVALGSVGVSYACFSNGWGKGHWKHFSWKSFGWRPHTTVCCTDDCDVPFDWVISNDDGTIDNVNVDPGDDGGGTNYDLKWFGLSSDDPSAPPPPEGPPCPRWDKDVARTTADISSCDKHSVTVLIENAYPSYYPTVFFNLKNKGKWPAKITSISIDEDYDGPGDESFDLIDELTVTVDGISEGQTIDVCHEAAGNLQIHVEQCADQDAIYKIRVVVNFDCTPEEQECDTAYAYGGNYATCFIGMPQLWNPPWGWTNGPLGHGHYEFPLYAGAAQCDISKGVLVGTVTIDYYGSTAIVVYNITNAGYTMDETHLYVGTKILPRNKWGNYTVSPGDYTKSHDLNNATTDTFTINGLCGPIYVIAHAVVCPLE